MIPDYLAIPAAELGKGTPVQVRILGDMASLAEDFARTLLVEIRAAQAAGRGGTFIVPVGPVDQFPILARLVNEARLSLRDVVFINMDEYLTDDDAWVPTSHPLSFRGYMERAFYGLLDPALAPPPELRVFPDPSDCGAVQRLIDARGGVDVTFGGIGINGHIAFNEPPDPPQRPSARMTASSAAVTGVIESRLPGRSISNPFSLGSARSIGKVTGRAKSRSHATSTSHQTGLSSVARGSKASFFRSNCVGSG